MYLLLLFAPLTTAFFFGGGGSSCGCAAPPACPPPPPAPVCAPPAPVCPPQPACVPSGYGGGASYQPQLVSAAVPAPAPVQAPFVGQSFAAAPIGGNSYQQAPAYQQQSFPAPAQTIVQAPVQTIEQGPAPSYQQGPVAEAPVQVEVVQEQPSVPSVIAQGQYQTASDVANAQPSQDVQVVEVEVPAEQTVEVAANPIYREIPGRAAAGSKNAEVIEEKTVIVQEEESGKRKAEGKTPSSGGHEEEKERIVDISTLKLTDDPLCNSDDLRKLMLENMDDNLNSSKRLIQLAAEAQFGGRFDVICANGDFSYVTNTELYCQETKADVSCYTYRQL